jgi:hypothetical protein
VSKTLRNRIYREIYTNLEIGYSEHNERKRNRTEITERKDQRPNGKRATNLVRRYSEGVIE